MRHVPLIAGIVILGAAWILAAAGHGVAGHMAAHMAAVCVAAPLLALGLAGTHFDPATRFPGIVTPLPMMLVELAVVWGWHVPMMRAWATHGAAGLALEQAMFATAGLLLWSACLGTRDAARSSRRAEGIIALLLTMMHMTLLGVLVAVAPRVLFEGAGLTLRGMVLTPMADQQLGGVVMLFIGAGSYLIGGLALLARILTSQQIRTGHP